MRLPTAPTRQAGTWLRGNHPGHQFPDDGTMPAKNRYVPSFLWCPSDYLPSLAIGERFHVTFSRLTRLPNLARLSLRLLQDPRVPMGNKAVGVGAIVLVLSPIDIPGWVPVLGQALDVLLILNILERFIHAAPRAVVEEHIAALGLTGKVQP